MSSLNARINVVTLLKINILKQVAANGPGRNGIAIHLDARYMRNRAFDRHQAFTQIFVDTWDVRFGQVRHAIHCLANSSQRSEIRLLV